MKKKLGSSLFAFPTPVWVIGSYDKLEKPNIMTIAWGGICCSKPPCLTISLRKATYTYGNIKEKKCFSVNIPSSDQIKLVDYLGIASGANEDKFMKSGLTPQKCDQINAPFIMEFPLILECKLVKEQELGLHTQFIGEIVEVKAEESYLDSKGNPDIQKIMPVVYSPPDKKYFTIGEHLGAAFSLGKELVKQA